MRTSSASHRRLLMGINALYGHLVAIGIKLISPLMHINSVLKASSSKARSDEAFSCDVGQHS